MSQVESLLEEGLLRSEVPLGPFTTYKSGGPARLFAELETRDDLERLIDSGVTASEPVLVLGRGSNLVVSDTGFDGLVIRLGRGFASISFRDGEVTAGGITPLPRMARSSVEQGLAGLEFFVGIPGSVGGAVRQNAGCFGMETRDRLITAQIVSLTSAESRVATPADLDLSYRHSNIDATDLVVDAVFATEPGEVEVGLARLRQITRWRRDHQPGGTLNAGSVFKNPPELSAGELIDSLGLKGLSVGDVAVSDKHANFFVAGPKATSADIFALVEEVERRVLTATGTKLETEIQFVGFEQ